MANIAYDVHIDNETYSALVSDSQKLADVKTLLETKFPDDTCALVAIKSILGIEEKTEEEPSDDTSAEGDNVPADGTEEEPTS